MEAETLIEFIRNNKISIYGTGYVAGKFYAALQLHRLTDQIDFFITSEGSEEQYKKCDVLSVNDNRVREANILVAVHESIKDEIVDNLCKYKCKNYLWINPELLYAMIFGKPIQKNSSISIKDIWLKNQDDYELTVRYLAIENYFGKNDYGFDMYKYVMALFAKRQSAECRLSNFCSLINNWVTNGYDETKPSKILDNYYYIDGSHRIAIALYFNQPTIKCDVYTNSENLKIIRNEMVSLSKKHADRWLDYRALKILEETKQRINSKYGLF